MVLAIVAAWLMADFLSGVFHWWEDRYGIESWPIVGPLIVAPNILHHSQPTAFLKGSLLVRNWTTFVPALTFAIVAFLCGYLWWAMVFVFVSAANEVHAWAHQKCSRPIRGLQLLGIIQSQEQHAIHHTDPFDRNYCVMTDWLNPWLTRVRFWEGVESVVAITTGARPSR